MEEKKVSVIDVLEMSVNNLSAIMIPAGMTEQIGIPIAREINNLKACIQAVKAHGEEKPEES